MSATSHVEAPEIRDRHDARVGGDDIRIVDLQSKRLVARGLVEDRLVMMADTNDSAARYAGVLYELERTCGEKISKA